MMIMPHPYGRMANRLVLSTAFIVQAEEYGDSFINLAFADYFRYFEGTKHSPFLYHRSANPVHFRKPKLFGCVNIWNTYDKRGETYLLDQASFLAKQQETRFLAVIGWSFRTPSTIGIKHKPVVKRIFTPVAQHREAVGRLAERLRAGSDHVVGVHIRQSDYKNFANGKYFYTLDVYRRVMSELAAQLKGRTRFLLCSDATLDPTDFADLDVMFGTKHPVEDNYALATCDYIVGPPSTYTAWASYYGDVPKQFIQSPDSKLALSGFEIQTVI
jgi:hypothetical protein